MGFFELFTLVPLKWLSWGAQHHSPPRADPGSKATFGRFDILTSPLSARAAESCPVLYQMHWCTCSSPWDQQVLMGFGSCRRHSPAADGSVSIIAPGTGTPRKCCLLCSPSSVQWNRKKPHDQNVCWVYIKAQLSNVMLQWKVHSMYMNENQLIAAMRLSKIKIRSFTNLNILWRGGILFF